MALDWNKIKHDAKENDERRTERNRKANAILLPTKNNAQSSGAKEQTAKAEPTKTTPLLPMRTDATKKNEKNEAATASGWISEALSKGAGQANRDRMEHLFSTAATPTPSQKREREHRQALAQMTELSRKKAAGQNVSDDAYRNAQDRVTNASGADSRKRSLLESNAMGTEYLGSGILRGFEAPLGAVDSAFWTVANEATKLPLIRSIPGMDKAQAATADYAARAQSLPFSSAWQRSIQERYQPNEAEQNVGDWESSIASYIPSLGLSAGIGAAAAAGQGAAALTAANTAAKGQRAGQLMMALQGMGSAAKEARDEGATTAQANLYGAADGLLGAATERISGGIPLLGNGVADRVVSKFATLPLDRAVADMAGEGFEEGLQTAAEPLLKRAIYDPDARNATLSEIGQSAAMGALASGALKLGIEAPQAVESGLQRFRAERSRGRAADAVAGQLRTASAQMDADTQADRTRSLERLDPIGDVSGLDLTSDTGRRTMRAGDGLLPPRAFGEVDYDTAPEGAEGTPRAFTEAEARTAVENERARVAALPAEVEKLFSESVKAGNGRADSDSVMRRYLELYQSQGAEGQKAMSDAFNKLAESGRYTWDESGGMWDHSQTRGRNGQLPDPERSIPMDERTAYSVGARKVNAFQFDHPELHDYFVEEARGMLDDLDGSMKGERIPLRDQRGNITGWTGVKRSTTADIAQMIDELGMSYGDIEQSCKDIIADHGQENYANAKRVEMALDRRMSDGYRDVTGRPYERNEDYLRAKDAIQGTDSFTEPDYGPEFLPLPDEVGMLDWREGEQAQTEAAPAPSEQGQTVQTKPVQSQTSAEAQQVGTIRVGQSDVPLYDRIPDGWKRTKGAQTAPRGYVWVDNNKSMFGGERKSGMVPESAVRPDMGQYRQEAAARAEPSTAVQSPPTGRPVGPESSVGAAANDAYGPNTVGAAQSAVPAAEPRISKVETNTFAHSGLYDNVDRDLAGLKPEDLSYDPVSEKQSLSHAAERLANDYAGELDALPKQESWSGEDIDTAMGILSDERARAMQSGDWSEFQKWRKLIQEKGTRAGQLVQAFAKYSRTPEGILVDAGKILEGTKLRPEQQAEVLQTVSRQAARLEDIDTAWRNAGSDESAQSAVKQDLIDTIKENSAIRKTGGFFGGGQTVSKRLAKALEGDSFDHLRDVALAQTANIAGDHVSASFLEKVNSYRTMGLLSNLGTTARNLVANNVFDPLDALLANNSMVPLDMLLSKLTGTRSVASVGSTPINAAKRQAMLDGWNKSYIEVALDANADGAQNKYGQTGKRTFKMTGNVAERLLSTWAKWQGYALNSTDEMQKGGIRQEETARAQKLRDKGLLRAEDTSLEAKPDETARYRTFQDDTALSGMAEDAKRALNRIGIGERKGGGKAIGAGDLLLTFPKVPSNLVSRAVEYSPAGFLKGARELADVLSKAHRASVDPSAPKVTALEQAHAVNDIGRALGGSALIALFAMLAKTGVLKVADAGGEESADQSALNTAERVSGTQLNLSAFKRLATGKSTQWQDGDQLMSIGFLEPLNAHMATGALFADSMEDGDGIGETGRKFLTASGAGVAQSLKDMPAATGLTSIADQYRYADGDTEGMKALNTAKGYLEEQASSFVPNIIRAVAKATDPYVRDAYSGQTMEQQTLDSVKNAIPGLRQTLPTKKDVWGQDRTYGDNKVLNALNAILLPGAVNTYQTTKAAQVLKTLPEVSGSPVLPQRSAPKSLSYDGQTYALSAQERSAYQKARGGLHQQLVEQVAGTDWYRNASDEDKVSIMNDVRAYANDEAKRAVLTSRAGSYQSNGWERIHEAVENGVPASSAFIYHETKDADGDGSVSQSEAAGVLLPMKGLTDAQKSTLWKATDSGWNPEKDPFQGTLPTKGGLSVEQSVKVLQTYRDIDKADYTGDKVASQKQTAFSKALDGMGLTKDQRTAVDGLYKFYTMMPAKVQAYSVDTMSEAAQKRWGSLKALGMSEAAYLQVYPIVAKSEKGYTKADKIRDLMALGYSKAQANTIYSKIQSK